MIASIKHTLCGHSQSVELGAVTAIIGPNGSGKTTLLHALQLALTGRLEWPADGRLPAKRNQDLGKVFLPPGRAGGEVHVEADGKTASAKVVRTKKGAVSNKQESFISDLDPLAYSLASWLEQTGPQRVKSMLDAAVLRDPTDADFAGVAWAENGGDLDRLADRAVSNGTQATIDEADEAIRKMQRDRTDAERRIKADQGELARTATPNRTVATIKESRRENIEALTKTNGEMSALEMRSADRGIALTRLASAQQADTKATQALAQLTMAEKKVTDALAKYDGPVPERVKTAALSFAAECADDAARAARDRFAGADAIRGVLERGLVCDTCAATLAVIVEGAPDRARLSVIEDTAAATHAQLRLAEETNKKIDDANNKILRLSEAKAEVAGRANDSAQTASDAFMRLTDAESDLERYKPSEHEERLKATAEGLKVAIATDDADLEAVRITGAVEARMTEAGAEARRLDADLEDWKEARADLVELRDRLLAEGLAPLDDVANAICHKATGGRLRFNWQRGGVDLAGAGADGRWRPLEAASVGERALALPAISVALQRAHGVEPVLLLDGLESLDRRFELLELCGELVSAGELAQVIACWTSTDIEQEACEARSAGAMVVLLGGAS